MIGYWDKAPRDLIALAWSKRWDRDNPAPDIIGYLLAGSIYREGGSMPIRTLRDHCGWTKHRATVVLARLRSDIGADKDRTDSDIDPDTRSPSNQRYRIPERTIPDIGADTRRTIPDTARDPSLQKREEKRREEDKTPAKADAVPVKATWESLISLFSEHKTLPVPQRLTTKRRKALRARLKDSSPADVLTVCTWALTSDHDRARFLRDGGHGIDTLLSTKFDQYAEFAAMPEQSRSPSTKSNTNGQKYDHPSATGALDRMHQRLLDEENSNPPLLEDDATERDQERPRLRRR